MQKLSIYAIFFLMVITIQEQVFAADELSVLFTANINGTLQNCKCGEDPLGGIDRIKTILDEHKKASKDVLIIDGGDYMNSYPFIELNTLMLNSMDYLGIDISVPGDQEFCEGVEFFESYRKTMGKAFLLSNLEDTAAEKVRRFKRGGFNVEVYGYLSPASFDFIKIPPGVDLLSFESIETLKQDNFEKPLRIVVYHGEKSGAFRTAEQHPWVDLMLLSHVQEENDWMVGNTYIVGCGRDGEHIAHIRIGTGNNGPEIELKRIKVSEKIIQDDKVKQLVAKYISLIK